MSNNYLVSPPPTIYFKQLRIFKYALENVVGVFLSTFTHNLWFRSPSPIEVVGGKSRTVNVCHLILKVIKEKSNSGLKCCVNEARTLEYCSAI